ncbi:hypothetical protein COU24_00800 [Candidatus Kuenenbacteria bacterium CG10_big_fil_rev_8_21_14_0_10_39_14]|uniref:Type 4 fimbrial biogenesis protein PilX N-terminal domain-containing protein n=3 Tax=Candidatus Kueneniibacteriota TaxID=1752740 RepID=A0A2M7MGF0_9BACT|nr:MAG: hypothetical protein AUK13_01580 [Candidatus Kuenenbacteria bacterium CG2_30_39_24]PIR81027.1 MAG: hypothetical protein COU24_00800 [Candidatus Kuenenbacteria bacterium CG10_big_fil_rev_8_21_14_0_10_39_14]PIX92193.1 MAG: hypothetical protein COZ26_03145 [Candidatus Kuenenbacteria bacterium CG_4_10_14_3_um_filter_39_14]
MFYFKKQLNRQSGIALVLSVLILTNLMMIALVVSDVILRIGKSSQGISQSEIAYFAAETAIEKAVYQIETSHNGSDLGTSDVPTVGNLSDTLGNWKRYIAGIYTTPITCFDDQQRVSFPADPATETDKSCVYAADLSQDVINKNNPLKVRLKPGKSFELSLNISTPASLAFYPSAVTIDWPTHAGKVIILSSDSQEVIDASTTTGSGKIPDSGQLGNSPNYRIRLINNSAADVIYTIAPQAASDSLPTGIAITSQGYYDVNKKERIIIVERKNWEIY